MAIQPAAAASCLIVPLTLLTACNGGGDGGNPWRERPAFLAAEPVRTDYDGTTQGLLTGKAASLTDLVTWRAPATPGAADLRTLALQTSYTGLLDTTPAGGFGTYYGRLSPAANQGTEYVALSDDGSGTRNVAIVVGIPSNFDVLKPCIVAIPSSGSRGVYGEAGTIGEWAYNKGCATALTDKGTGVGLHDLDRDLAPALDGALVPAGQRKDLSFNANLLGDDLASFRSAFPNRVAMKHAHGKQNPEKDWGRYTLQAVQTALYVLNRHFPQADFTPANTLVIASSISNGGGAVLRAAEADTSGLIDAVVAGEPQVNLPDTAAVQVRRGGTTLPAAGKPLLDYFSFAGLYQACASQAPSVRATSAFVIQPIAANRCARLTALGLVTGSTLDEQSADALARMHAYGWEPESDLLHDSHYGSEFADLVSTTYVNAYARASVTERLCGYSFAGIDAALHTPVPPATDALATAWATGGGLGYLAGAFNVIYDDSVGGPALYLTAVSPSSGQADFALDAAACVRRLVTRAAVGTTVPTATELALGQRVREGMGEIRVAGDLHGKPAIVLHGRADALLPVNHTSRPYAAFNAAREPASRLRYYEVTDANHFDALVGLYPRTLVPLHVYNLRALDLMYAHLSTGALLPPSQVVRATARASASTPLTDANVPPIAATPSAAEAISVLAGAIDVPN
jgi:hydroxybutyrate-dimer hydrolase